MGGFVPTFGPPCGEFTAPGVTTMIEKQFGTLYGPALQRSDKTACIANLHAEIDRRGGIPYGWIRIYEVLLFAFYNPRTGPLF
jgi:hypothetical protein